MTATTRRRASAVLGGAAIACLLGTGAADAAVTASAAAASATGTLSWSATLTDPGGTLLTGRPHTANYTSLAPFTTYLTSRNTGTAALTGQVYSVTGSGFVLSGASLNACTSGPWQNGTCPGGQVVPITSGATAALPVAPGAAVGLRLTLPAGIGMSVSLSVATTRAHVRAATTTQS
ncbi:hypothetical protein [Saccharothrix sp. Mg75]|uniref:hypothetical protein n=1 Tax=Saccharothrix sp. Mg75 TaxID=3445357 RepID=UPI003EEA8565